MAKQGMKRPDWTQTHPKNDNPPVPQIQGKAKSGKRKANPIIAGTSGPEQKVWHGNPYDSDLAMDNLNQDIPYADLQDL